MEVPVDGLPLSSAGRIMVWKRELLICLLLSVGFGIFVTSASQKMDSRQEHQTESVQMDRAILRGQSYIMAGRESYLPPWQNRVLVPAVLELCIHLGVFTPNGWYL